MKLDLSLDRIQDQAVREALSRIQDQFRSNPLLGGNWKQFDLEFESSGSEVPVRHNLPFVPEDVLLLYVEGDHNLYFRHDLFDRENIYIEVAGPCRIRFLAGRVGRM